MIAQLTNEVAGQGLFLLMALLSCLGGAVGIGSYFATRRDLDKLEARVDHLEGKLSGRVGKLHARINRLLAGQMLIAGKLGVVLKQLDEIENEEPDAEDAEQ